MNYDLVNDKNSTVIEFGTCNVDVFCQLLVKCYIVTICTVECALRYKPEGHGFDSQWCHRNFSLTQSFLPHYGPGIDSASNRNEY